MGERLPPPERHVLRQYGAPSTARELAWPWVDEALRQAGSYWLATTNVVGEAPGQRPVWGVWSEHRLQLSVGSPTLRRGLAGGAPVTVNLASDVDVVILEGIGRGPTDDDRLVASYNEKYDWDYTIEGYGPLTTIEPTKIMAWRSAGWAGRGGFQETGAWRFDPGVGPSG